MTTYEFIIEHLSTTYPAIIPVIDSYISTWTEDDKQLHLGKHYANDLSGTIYPYLAAYRTLEEAGVENAERIITELREKELM